MADPRGKFLWHELMTTDVEAAKAFYTEVVGWKTQVWTESGQPYQMLMAGDAGVGGIMTLPDDAKKMGAPPHWIAYIGSREVDSTVAQTKQLGGQVYFGPMDIPKVGRFAVLADPQGAAFAVLTPAPMGDSTPPEAKAGEGKFTWNELMTSDPDGAWKFYSALFGWAKHESMDMGPAGTYQLFGAPGEEKASYGGYMKLPADLPAPPHWVHYASVPDLDKSLEITKKRGGTVLHGPIEVPGGDHVAVCKDPQGAVFALHAKG